MHDDYKVEFCGKNFDCVDKGFNKDENIDVVIRPEDIKMTAASEGMLIGIVTSVVFKGVHYEIEVDENGRKWIIHSNILLSPINLATNAFSGSLYISSGVPICCILPLFITTIVSDIVNASS